MIIDKIIEWIFNTFISISQTTPTLTVPAGFDSGMVYFTNAVSGIFDMRAWINFPALRNALIFILAAYALAAAYKIQKQFISLITGGGGNA